MNFIECLKYYAELGYFIAGIVLAIAAIYGLKQIKISKVDIEERKKRASLEKAIEYADLYESKFIPLIEKFNEQCHGENFILFDYEELKDFNCTQVEREMRVKRFLMGGWRHALNVLETIAASFITGVADKDTGYSIIGPSFCYQVFKVHDLIVTLRKSAGRKSSMEMTIKLYKIWAPRYQAECFPKDEPVK